MVSPREPSSHSGPTPIFSSTAYHSTAYHSTAYPHAREAAALRPHQTTRSSRSNGLRTPPAERSAS
eukprot:6200484-Pleurochrysis_carterae.AAC.4